MDPPTCCGNCQAPMTGEFCSACGQRRARRLSFGRSLTDAWSQLGDFDFALVRTFVGLSTRPGTVALEYIAGRRRNYSNPFRYAFIATTATVLAISLLNIDISMPGVPIESERDRAAVKLLTSLISYVFFPAILLLAWLQWAIGRKGRFVYAEVLVFDAYCLSHSSLFTIVLGPVLPPGEPVGFALLMSCQLAYVAWCLRGFRGVSWPSAVGRAAAIAAGYIVIFNLIGLGLVNGLAVAGLF
jgi:hypothetical protein